MPSQISNVRRGLAEFILDRGIGHQFKEHFYGRHGSPHCSLMERGVPKVANCIHVGSSFDQVINLFDNAKSSHKMQQHIVHGARLVRLYELNSDEF